MESLFVSKWTGDASSRSNADQNHLGGREWLQGTRQGVGKDFISSAAINPTAQVALLQMPAFLPPAGIALMGCGMGCCLFALGWSYDSVRMRGITAPMGFSGCGVGIGMGCVGVGQGYGRYVPWAKDRRPMSLRKDLKESADDVLRFFERIFHGRHEERNRVLSRPVKPRTTLVPAHPAHNEKSHLTAPSSDTNRDRATKSAPSAYRKHCTEVRG